MDLGVMPIFARMAGQRIRAFTKFRNSATFISTVTSRFPFQLSPSLLGLWNEELVPLFLPQGPAELFSPRSSR
jgi:hypothetical protein